VRYTIYICGSRVSCTRLIYGYILTTHVTYMGLFQSTYVWRNMSLLICMDHASHVYVLCTYIHPHIRCMPRNGSLLIRMARTRNGSLLIRMDHVSHVLYIYTHIFVACHVMGLFGYVWFASHMYKSHVYIYTHTRPYLCCVWRYVCSLRVTAYMGLFLIRLKIFGSRDLSGFMIDLLSDKDSVYT